MYEFIDTVKAGYNPGQVLPSEALQINGEFIENQIAGYRTLTVTGREALSPEVSTYDTGIRDGSWLKGKRYPARVIRVTYQIKADSNEEFRAAYNKLASILNVEDAELIFNDETDKYFIGTPANIGEVPPGRNSVVGDFEILCLDPFKYSVIEYEAESVSGDNSILLDYNGTYKSFPKLRAEFYNEDEAGEDGSTPTALTGAGDCGYVAFFNENENIIQLGDPDETEGEDYPKSQTLVNQSFKAATNWGGVSQANWKVNSGITSSSAVEQKGAPGCGVVKKQIPVVNTPNFISVTSEGAPPVQYNVSAKAFERTNDTAKVTFTVTTRLTRDTAYLGEGIALIGQFFIDGVDKREHIFYIKQASEYWKGQSAHTVNVTIAINAYDKRNSEFVQFNVFREGSQDIENQKGKAGTILGDGVIKWFDLPPYEATEIEAYYLCATNYGSGNDWHGPSITRVLPADVAGEVGAKNFTLSYSQHLCIGLGNNAVKEHGAFQALAVSGSGTSRKIVAGVNIYKGSEGKKANLRFYVGGKVVKTETIDLSYNNKYFKSSTSTVITKTGGVVTFNIGGLVRRFKDINVTNTVVNEITFTFTKFGTKPSLSHNGLFNVKFVKDNCTTWANIPNKFSANDVVEADCRTGEITLNGISMPSYGALGNEWEAFYLRPGFNQIGFAYSEWTPPAYAPKFKLKYREVFL